MNLQVIELKKVITSRQPGVKAGLGAFERTQLGARPAFRIFPKSRGFAGLFQAGRNEPILILNPGGSRI
jgi:hypothetical protein